MVLGQFYKHVKYELPNYGQSYTDLLGVMDFSSCS